MCRYVSVTPFLSILECGVLKGGEGNPDDPSPWTVAIYRRNRYNCSMWHYWLTGVIIGKYTVLTGTSMTNFLRIRTKVRVLHKIVGKPFHDVDQKKGTWKLRGYQKEDFLVRTEMKRMELVVHDPNPAPNITVREFIKVGY